MAKFIRDISPLPQMIRDTSAQPPRLDPAAVATALGAEPTGHRLEEGLAPVTRFATRAEVFGRLQSGGGQPAPAGVSSRTSIPVGEEDWKGLEELAALIATPESTPTPAQIAKVLLSQSIQTLTAEVAKSATPEASPQARDLAARVGISPADHPMKQGA